MIGRKNPARRAKQSKSARIVWGVYQQVAAAYASLGILRILGRYLHIEWKGFLAAALDLWEVAREVVGELARGLITIPSGWFGAGVEVPLVVRDYLSVGLVIASFLWKERNVPEQELMERFSWEKDSRHWTALAAIPLWPLVIVSLFFYGLYGWGESDDSPIAIRFGLGLSFLSMIAFCASGYFLLFFSWDWDSGSRQMLFRLALVSLVGILLFILPPTLAYKMSRAEALSATRVVSPLLYAYLLLAANLLA